LRKELVFCLEESSAKVFINGILERIRGEKIPVQFIVFEGKKDLDNKLLNKLKGYLNEDAFFIVLRDQDLEDCKEVKNKLIETCTLAGKKNFAVRIACRELESWYLADLDALKISYPETKIKFSKSIRNRVSDEVQKPSLELKKILPEFQKTNSARLISKNIDIENPKSKSFYHFLYIVKNFISKTEFPGDI
jgi:hypothetical protein